MVLPLSGILVWVLVLALLAEAHPAIDGEGMFIAIVLFALLGVVSFL